jgi:hypothetical protein
MELPGVSKVFNPQWRSKGVLAFGCCILHLFTCHTSTIRRGGPISIRFLFLMRYLLLLLLLVLASCSPSESVPPIEEVRPEIEEWTLYPKADGKPYLQSHAGKTYLADLSIGRIGLLRDSVGHLFVFEDGITLRIFREGILFMEMKGEQAGYNPLNKQVLFLGMTSFSLNEEELELESMTWKAGESMVRTEGFVQLVNQKQLVEGRGFEGTLNLGSYRIDHISSVIDLTVGE